MAALDREVDAPPAGGFVERAGAERSRIERPGDPEQGVADGLGLQSVRDMPREQGVVRVPLPLGLRARRRLAIRLAGHHQPVEGLEAPTAPDEFTRQPIEQFRVRGGSALGPEIIGRGDEPLAEMVLPQAVDDHPRHEVARALGRVGHPKGQRSASARIRGSSRGLPVPPGFRIRGFQ